MKQSETEIDAPGHEVATNQPPREFSLDDESEGFASLDFQLITATGYISVAGIVALFGLCGRDSFVFISARSEGGQKLRVSSIRRDSMLTNQLSNSVQYRRFGSYSLLYHLFRPSWVPGHVHLISIKLAIIVLRH